MVWNWLEFSLILEFSCNGIFGNKKNHNEIGALGPNRSPRSCWAFCFLRSARNRLFCYWWWSVGYYNCCILFIKKVFSAFIQSCKNIKATGILIQNSLPCQNAITLDDHNECTVRVSSSLCSRRKEFCRFHTHLSAIPLTFGFEFSFNSL